MKEDTILKVLPWDVRSIIQKEKLEFEYLQEIRLREGKPLIFLYHDTEVIPGAPLDMAVLPNLSFHFQEIKKCVFLKAVGRCRRFFRIMIISKGHRIF